MKHQIKLSSLINRANRDDIVEEDKLLIMTQTGNFYNDIELIDDVNDYTGKCKTIIFNVQSCRAGFYFGYVMDKKEAQYTTFKLEAHTFASSKSAEKWLAYNSSNYYVISKVLKA